MNIQTVTSTKEFDSLTESWRKLAVWQFGPLCTLDDEDTDATVLVATVDGEAAAYLIAESSGAWHVETRPEHRGRGYARTLCQAANVTFAWEVCSDEGAAFAESLGIDFDDARE
jgi:GNAT superfamily N-acetyltransferase